MPGAPLTAPALLSFTLPASLVLAAIHAALGLVWLGALSAAVHRARRWVTRAPTRRAVEALSGAAFIALGARVALACR
jgi:threonine/homoserine/homoserine lactone efflux protein